MKPTVFIFLGLAIALAGCRQPDPVEELEGVAPWKRAIFCSATLERSAQLFVRLARSSEDTVERDELTREARERREAALEFGQIGVVLGGEAGIDRSEIRRSLGESDALFEERLQNTDTIEDYAAHLADRVAFCEDTVRPTLD